MLAHTVYIHFSETSSWTSPH